MSDLKAACLSIFAAIFSLSHLTAQDDIENESLAPAVYINAQDSFSEVIRSFEDYLANQEDYFPQSDSNSQTGYLQYKIQPDGSIIVMPCRKAHGRNYNASVSHQEKKDIRYIINTLAQDSLASIGTSRSSLKKAGDRIDHIHPLRFLLTVFLDEELKVGMHAIRGRGGWIWDEFADGLTKSLREEASRQNLRSEFIQDFSAQLGLNIYLILPPIQESRWKDFLNILIDYIPRANDPNRYRM